MEYDEIGQVVLTEEEWIKNDLEDFRRFIANMSIDELKALRAREGLTQPHIAMIDGKLSMRNPAYDGPMGIFEDYE